jgi:hypothetical protein
VEGEKRLLGPLFGKDCGYQLLLIMMGARSLDGLTARWAYQTRARESEKGSFARQHHSLGLG